MNLEGSGSPDNIEPEKEPLTAEERDELEKLCIIQSQAGLVLKSGIRGRELQPVESQRICNLNAKDDAWRKTQMNPREARKKRFGW